MEYFTTTTALPERKYSSPDLSALLDTPEDWTAEIRESAMLAKARGHAGSWLLRDWFERAKECDSGLTPADVLQAVHEGMTGGQLCAEHVIILARLYYGIVKTGAVTMTDETVRLHTQCVDDLHQAEGFEARFWADEVAALAMEQYARAADLKSTVPPENHKDVSITFDFGASGPPNREQSTMDIDTHNGTGPRGHRRALIRNIGDIPEGEMEWDWEPWLLRGEFHLLAGFPKSGKTTLTQTLASLYSVGAYPFSECGRVLVISTEGAWSRQKKVLRAAGMDTDRVDVICDVAEGDETVPVSLAVDMDTITAEVAQAGGYDLIILDPVIEVAGTVRNSFNPGDVRQAIAQIARLQRVSSAAVVGVTHYKKGARKAILSGEELSDQIIGSDAWRQVARAVWYTWPHPKGAEWGHKIGTTGNWVYQPQTFDYSIESWKQDRRIPVIRMSDAPNFGEDIEIWVPETAREKSPRASAEDHAKIWIRQRLPTKGAKAKQSIIRAEIEDAGKTLNFGWDTLRRVDLKPLGIHKKRAEFGGGSVWENTGTEWQFET